MERGDRATLVKMCDPAGRTRGTGFVADDRGTVVTSHEAVDGLVRVVVHAPDGRTFLAEADAITPLPESALALVRTEGLGVPPLPIATRARIATGTYVRLAARGWRDARVLGDASVTYTAADRFHPVDDVLELAIGTEGREALRLGGEAAGGPVLDAATGAVLGVLGTALHAGHRAAGFALPLARAAAAAPGGPLAELLRRNAATVPAYGRDLNLAAALELATTTGGSAGGPSAWPDPVQRPAVARELERFAASDAVVFALVGDPGTGRSTELRALAARRATGLEPAPTVHLRGADLRADDSSVADAVARALRQAGRIVACSGAPGEMGTATPERIARLALDWGRPLVVLLDSPEEMPPVLAHRLPRWTAGTVSWLRSHAVRLVIACRPEHWELAGALYPPGTLHRPGRPAWRMPDALRIGDLSGPEATRARERYGLPGDAIAADDARHPLALRLLAEVREALPGDVPGRPRREEVFAAHLDLMCLRVAVRVAAASRASAGPAARGAAVRRLAARVAGRVHEAARRCLGPGHGELDREAFEELFPWSTGWAAAVLTEGLLVPAGAGYRFGHEELADWLQGAHLDLDAALHSLVHRWHEDAPVGLPSRAAGEGSGAEAAAAGLPVPRHRIGPVLQALLLLDRVHGPAALVRRLDGLIEALDRLADRASALVGAAAWPEASPNASPEASPEASRVRDAVWWGAQLVGETLLRVPDVRPYLGVLRLLADRVSARAVREGGPRQGGPRQGSGCDGGGRDGLGLGEFGPWFWERLRLGEDDRVDLLRRLVPADATPGTHEGTRYLDAVAARLAADPRGVQPLLCRWFTDERPLPAEGGAHARHVPPTVAGAAQALLYAHRHLAVDDLCEALITTAHPRAHELLTALAEDEPSALCRAVDHWAHDDARPGRRTAAAAHGPLVARHVTDDADRELLRYAALALLARPGDLALHGPALSLLVRDPQTRARHLPQALTAFRAGAPGLPASALATALNTHPEPVLAAFRTRLAAGPGPWAEDVLTALAAVTTPALARRAATLVVEYVDRHPRGAVHAAAYVDRRLEQGPAARAVLFPLVSALLRGRPLEVRRALAPVLAAPGTRASAALRAELLDVLLESEEHEEYDAYEAYGSRDVAVPDALLRAAALGWSRRPEPRTRELVHRTGRLLIRTPEGATCFDRRLVELAREFPGFGALVARWLAQEPHAWATVVGPSTRRTLLGSAGPTPMRVESCGHGSLRPA
ncbi:serine protease [Streptomyces ficellus]|uniref:Serine protease n=1 Tax=Streptomyces ficellus TaxID=1977088 RepID=A0ABT7ZEL1_9ACTN|nr:serine protease [Streptomyces ficellus]MDN3297446.1 serine protease [Streptomyces ficellus]